MCRTDFTQFRANSTIEYIKLYFECFQSSSRKQQAYETFSSFFAFSHSSKNQEFENAKEKRVLFVRNMQSQKQTAKSLKNSDFNLQE